VIITSDREFTAGDASGLNYRDYEATEPRVSLWVRSGFAGLLQRLRASLRTEPNLASCSPESVKELLALRYPDER
jgi:hypothetical protein